MVQIMDQLFDETKCNLLAKENLQNGLKRPYFPHPKCEVQNSNSPKNLYGIFISNTILKVPINFEVALKKNQSLSIFKIALKVKWFQFFLINQLFMTFH